MRTDDAESLRLAAARLRLRAKYADGPAYHDDVARAAELDAEAARLERDAAEARARRRRQIAAIHAAKRDLGLDEETYRAMLWSVARVRSAADLDAAGRQAVLDHLRARGAQRRPRQRVAEHPGRPHNLDREQMLQKVEALLAELAAPWAYADAIARRQAGVERVAWCKPRQLRGVIAALHVEREKRELLQALDAQLADLHCNREALERLFQLRRGWERSRRTLRMLLDRLAQFSEET